MIKSFTPTNLKQIRADIDKALASVMRDHGISVSIGSMSYRDQTFSARMTATIVSDSDPSTFNTKWKAAFIKSCRMFGLSQTDFGKAIVVGGVSYVIAGARPKAKQPIVLQRISDGNHIAIDYDPVVAALR